MHAGHWERRHAAGRWRRKLCAEHELDEDKLEVLFAKLDPKQLNIRDLRMMSTGLGDEGAIRLATDVRTCCRTAPNRRIWPYTTTASATPGRQRSRRCCRTAARPRGGLASRSHDGTRTVERLSTVSEAGKGILRAAVKERPEGAGLEGSYVSDPDDKFVLSFT